MKGRLETTFQQLEAAGRTALITFVTAGDPDLSLTERLLPILAKAGADIIELGMPFSDPMADGPTIQLASERALASGTTLAGILETVTLVRRSCQTPIVLMGYFNPIHSYGFDRFARDAAQAGVDALLIVDLPPEEAGPLRTSCHAHGLQLIFLVAPTSTEERLARLLPMAGGFIYYVSLTGVTGVATLNVEEVSGSVAALKGRTSLPVVVGFGISRPEQAAEFGRVADGVVVGSAIVRLFEEYNGEELLRRVETFVAELRTALDA
jgi:tryptophan synthase alpha chain